MTTELPSPFLSADPLTAEMAPAAVDWNPAAAGADISELLEIADSRFVLDVMAFMEAIEDVPLFLRRAG